MAGVRWDVRHLPFGVTSSGEVLCLPLLGSHWLLGGLSGAGKSSGIATLLAGVAVLPDVQLVLIDPKRVELTAWTPRAAMVGTTPQTIREALQAAHSVMQARFATMEADGRRLIVPTVDEPLVLVVVDELAMLVASGNKPDDDKRTTLLRELVALGRAAAVSVVMATQRPSHDVVPTALRDLVPLRIAFATATPESTVMLLGEQGRDVARAHEIPHGRPGVCFVVSETSRIPVRARSYLVADAQVAGIVAATAHLRRPLEVLAPV